MAKSIDTKSPETRAHQEWLGYVQPIGLIVSVPAMLEAQCYINKNIAGEHARFLECLVRGKNDEIIPELADLAAFTQKVLGWEAADLKEIPQRVPLPAELSSLDIILPQYHETLRPTHAVPAFEPKEGESPWQMLVQQLPNGTNLDDASEADSSRHWHAAPQLKFERLLRETGIPVGLLIGYKAINKVGSDEVAYQQLLRLVYAPRGESSGHATFNVDEMAQVAGRPMFAALHMLLSADRMFTLGENQRLPAILAASRKYQNTVSNKLAEQVLAALYELMRGFQAADDVRKGDLLREVLAKDPNEVYSGLLRVLMRLVFVLYAEDRDLMSSDPVYSNNYSLTGLFERLREDAGRYPDTMDSRFGAWSQLLTLFRLVFEGGQHGSFKLPPRKGYLFDPERYPFLEGRNGSSMPEEPAITPRISDGVVYRVLRNLLVLDGERLSYRTLDVEQIGSVYETIMGFNLEVARGQSIAIKPVKSHGAPATINLDELLATAAKDRAKWIKETTDQKITGQALKDLKAAKSIDDLLTALDKKIAKKVTPRVVVAGSMVLQPSDERRRSGSHYTPRSLTKPIVETTLAPILKQLVEPPREDAAEEKTLLSGKGRKTKVEQLKTERDEEAIRLAQEKGTPHPRQILNLKVCDPAMGSGAFLVEACRQLGDELVAAWHAHECVPTADIPPDEDEILYARRLVAQRCLYGVDKNPMAVDLSKLSLWLATLAKDHPFTFLDHSLRFGDSLVGLTAEQIASFTWEQKPSRRKRSEGTTFQSSIQSRLERATAERRKILDAREDAPYRDQEQRMSVADEALSLPRLIGDACVAAFFSAEKKKARGEQRDLLFGQVADYLDSKEITKREPIGEAVRNLRAGAYPVPPFNWEIEFPEVFARANGGFDAFVGNPPFLGGKRISTCYGGGYRDWLTTEYVDANNNADLVAFFFRRSFNLLRDQGTLGLIATNSISQGDTRSAGLRWIVCEGGGSIYNATKRLVWPGEVAVVVSIVHIAKNAVTHPCFLNNVQCNQISAFLFHAGSSSDPIRLRSNQARSFIGCFLRGKGFLFEQTTENEESSSLTELTAILETNAKCEECVFPFFSGSEINDDPRHAPKRWVINFGSRSIEEAGEYPQLLEVLRTKVKPVRDKLGSSSVDRAHKKHWWRFANDRPEMNSAVANLDRILVVSRVRATGFTFVTPRIVPSEQVVVFAFDGYDAFTILQSHIHEIWAHFFSGTALDLIRYSPSDCFETFPFPEPSSFPSLQIAGERYFQHRAELMLKANEGLTDTYNRFHSPHDKTPAIDTLRGLHDEMDRAVLNAYGWDDLAEQATCEFLLDYEEGEDDDPTAKKSKKKKPWRYRWPDEFRDEVLARLLELNEQRAMEEKLSGNAADEKAKAATPKRKKSSGKSKAPASPLFQNEMERQSRYVLLILRAWNGIPFTRRAFNKAMILMLDDGLRKARLADQAAVSTRSEDDPSINQILTELRIDGFVEIDNSGAQQLVTINQAAPSTDDAPTDELERVKEVREYFELEAQRDRATIAETVDADFDLVPA